MGDEPGQHKPSGPLKILTLDGGGLQAISTLLILNKVLENIAKQEGHKKPKPCDVFDTIAGIGAGGWLAILLGRFRMDITACLTEWYKLVKCITPESKSEELRLRLFQHCYFDTDRLMEQVDRLTRVYGTGYFLFEDDPEGARTRHVFVAALESETKGYKLFRSYEIPSSAKLPAKLLEGPENPSKFQISHAFGVTGAARYFTPKWKEQMASSGKIRFRDTKFPKPHNITELALDEMWGIYGVGVPLSIVLTIGPGFPSDVDLKQMARRFSWSSNALGAGSVLPPTPNLSQFGGTPPGSPRFVHPDEGGQDSKQSSNRLHGHQSRQASASTRAIDGGSRAESRTNTFGSIRNRDIDTKLRRMEDHIEADVRKKLQSIYSDGSEIYVRLAPTNAPEGTPQNDSAAPGVASNATIDYLSMPGVAIAIDEVVNRMLKQAQIVPKAEAV